MQKLAVRGRAKNVEEKRISALGQIRTADLQFRKLLLYPLSYKGLCMSNLVLLGKLATLLLFSSEHPVELVKGELDDDRPAVRTGVGFTGSKKVVDECAHLFKREFLACHDGVAT